MSGKFRIPRDLFALIGLASCFFGNAQEVHFTAYFRGLETVYPGVRLEIRHMQVEDGFVDLELATGEAVGLGLEMRQNQALGPLGTGQLALAASGDTQGRFLVGFRAQGVLGPVAGTAALVLRNAPVGTFDPAEAFAASAPPDVTGEGLWTSAAFGLRYRPDRNWILDAEPEMHLVDGGLAFRLAAEAERLRLFSGNDVLFRLWAFGGPRLERVGAAIGTAVDFNRRRAQPLRIGVWLGWGGEGLRPGAVMDLSGRVEGATVGLTAAIEPFREDALPYRFGGHLDLEIPEGSLHVDLHAGWRESAAPMVVFTTTFVLPWDPASEP